MACNSRSSGLLACLTLVCAACQFPSVKTHDDALEVVRSVLVHPYARDVYTPELLPDLELLTVAADSVSFARAQQRYGFRYRDVEEIDLVEEEGFPGHDRVTIELVFEPASYSARRLASQQEEDALSALLYAPRLRFPGRTRWQAARLRQAISLLAVDPEPAGRAPAPVAVPPAGDPPPVGSLKERLSELKECLDAGLISEEEYQRKKTELLDDF